jgi:hypothetical protein
MNSTITPVHSEKLARRRSARTDLRGAHLVRRSQAHRSSRTEAEVSVLRPGRAAATSRRCRTAVCAEGSAVFSASRLTPRRARSCTERCRWCARRFAVQRRVTLAAAPRALAGGRPATRLRGAHWHARSRSARASKRVSSGLVVSSRNPGRQPRVDRVLQRGRAGGSSAQRSSLHSVCPSRNRRRDPARVSRLGPVRPEVPPHRRGDSPKRG